MPAASTYPSIEHAQPQPASGPTPVEHAPQHRTRRLTSACALARRFNHLREAERRLSTLATLCLPDSPRLQKAAQRVALLAARYRKAARDNAIDLGLKLRILQDAADGKSYKHTAADLNLHLQEIEQIAMALFREYGAENKTHLVAIALRRQLIN